MPIAIQNRIIIGTTFFVGILLLVGWILINEGGRMQAFTTQYQGRSIENGAATFLSACSTCHGVDGKGIAGRAPALDNPMLFLDQNPAYTLQQQISCTQPPGSTQPCDDLTKELANAQAQVKKVSDEQTQLTQLQQQINADTDPTKKQADQDAYNKLQTQASRDQANLPSFQKNVTDLQQQLDKANADLKALVAQGWDPTRQARLKEVGWGGTLKDYVTDAVSAGRPLSGSYWGGNVMPTWGQAYGGPLRPDEVDDVVQYVLNFHDEAVKLTPKDVNQQFSLPVANGGGAASASADAIFTKFGQDPNGYVDKLGNLKGGNAQNGAQLYQTLGCASCHLTGSVGPITKGTYTRILTQRLKDPAFNETTKTPETYIAQSILYPSAYIVPSYPNPSPMTATFGTQITIDQLKDLIAYLEQQ